MNPSQLRETTMATETRRLVQLTVDGKTMDEAREMLDMLLAKKRASDRRDWLQDKGNLAESRRRYRELTEIRAPRSAAQPTAPMSVR